MTSNNSWHSASLSSLTSHVVGTHHAYLYHQLPLLGSLLTAHLRKYWLKHIELLKAHKLFFEMKTAIEQHLIKEETAGFPLVEAWEKDNSRSLVPFLKNIDHHVEEHATVLSLLKEIRQTLWNYQVPEDMGAEVSYTVAELEALEKDLLEHIRLENEILFPRIQEIAAS